MLRLLRAVLFCVVAVVVGAFVGAVPIEGRTLGDRLMELYRSAASEVRRPERAPDRREGGRPAAKPPTRAKPSSKVAGAPAPTAGAANAPETHGPEDREAVERIIADRTRAR